MNLAVSALETLGDQEGPVRALKSMLKKRKLPHALLFTGIEGVGKQSCAMRLAMALNCIHPSPRPDTGIPAGIASATPAGMRPCESCRPCRKIATLTHPDVIVVEPQGQYIKIDQIRELCQTLSLQPYEAKTRVVILAGADTLNPEAGNALLKSLEEPPPRTIYVLTARQRDDLLPTVASRCQHIRFNPLAHRTLSRSVQKASGLDMMAARVIASAAEGSMARAAAMLEEDWLGLRDWLLRALYELPGQSYTLMLALADRLARDKDVLASVLEILQLWFRDLAVFKFSPDAIVNQDKMDIIRVKAGCLEIADVMARLKAVQSAEADIARNTHPRLAMEAMLIAILDREYGFCS